ncbi:MAG: hypothetical protein GXP55_02350 [Deltaproteobacteria bacterium]|nr:hypothetical protein [Deltaproteobacteria bacterium]
MNQRRGPALWATAIITLAAVWLSTIPAKAIPAFARRYQTSCQTCHTIYPALTPFGEAFRRNGYRFPGDDDEDRTEEEPLELGHEIQADLFPDEVWPGQIPGNVPLAVYVMPMVSLQRGPGGGGHGAEAAVERRDGGAPAPAGWGTGFGGQMGLITAGNLGRHLSFFGKLEISADGDVSLERPNVTITPFDSPYLNIKLGNFEPSLLGFSIHRSLTGHQLAFTTSYLGDNEWTPEPTQTGIELNGTLAHRFSYSAGLVDGQANVRNRQKDVYGRLEYKFGGMSFDGTEATGYSQPWQELSMTIGASFYRGDATIRDPMGIANEHDTFWRASADASFHLKDATVILSGFRQEDNRPLITTSDSGNLTGAMAEVSYVVFPWMIPVLRYTMFRQNLPGQARTGQRITAGLAMLLRANVSVRLLASGVQNTGEDATLEDATLALQATF